MTHELIVVGVNHRTAPVEIRERLAFPSETLDEANRRVRDLPGVEESLVLSTCNRVEAVCAARDGDRAVAGLKGFFADVLGAASFDLDAAVYTHRGRESVRHLYRVASSLDSMVVGEPQILGQIKSAYARAAGVGTTGTILHRCVHKAFSVAKRVRSETGIATRAVSVSSAAVELATRIFDRLSDKTAMLIGAGKMGELTVRHLLAHGTGSTLVTNRTFDRAVELARELGATPVPFDGFTRYLPLADIVIGCVGGTGYVLGPDQVQEALRERKGRPMFCIDLGVPRNFDPRINDMANAYLYDVDDLGGVAEENLAERAAEARKGEAIVESEVDSLWRWLGQLDVVPTIVALREKAEAIRRAELQKTFGALKDLNADQRDALDALTSAIVKKLLHTPITCMKNGNHREEAFYVDAARRLFGLDPAEDS